MSTSKTNTTNVDQHNVRTHRCRKYKETSHPKVLVTCLSLLAMSGRSSAMSTSSKNSSELGAIASSKGRHSTSNLSRKSNYFSLKFRDSDEDQSRAYIVQNGQHSWWNALYRRSVCHGSGPRNVTIRDSVTASSDLQPETQQYVLDNYLESIDKRYKRLHQGERKEDTSSQKGFTNALKWIMHMESSSQLEELKKQEDALYVLGLAELASNRLLQKHHLPCRESVISPPIDYCSVIDTCAEPVVDKGDLFANYSNQQIEHKKHNRTSPYIVHKYMVGMKNVHKFCFQYSTAVILQIRALIASFGRILRTSLNQTILAVILPITRSFAGRNLTNISQVLFSTFGAALTAGWNTSKTV
mmetsp:Transcript_18048/g.25500  ORF Transcript_18048/g.25500 Transcript_18048/m.25500 type:complete len:356 (-) Transcript_18048:282-1349(-)